MHPLLWVVKGVPRPKTEMLTTYPTHKKNTLLKVLCNVCSFVSDLRFVFKKEITDLKKEGVGRAG